MSNSFLKNQLGDLIDTLTESQYNLPKQFKLIDIANKTSNEFDSVTSVLNQNGGAFSATSADNMHDVNKLISMLTSESSANNAQSETSTANLEQQLRDILNQNGGSKKNRKVQQRGGFNGAASIQDVKKFFYDLKGSGIDVDVKLNGQTMSDFFNQGLNTTTDISETSDVGNVDPNMLARLSSTSEDFVHAPVSNKSRSELPLRLVGGKDKDLEAFEQDGGRDANPTFLAMNDLKKMMSKELNVKMGKPIMKVFSAVWGDAKAENPDLKALDLVKKAKELFMKNMDKYRKVANSA
jgi:hypothetical protein